MFKKMFRRKSENMYHVLAERELNPSSKSQDKIYEKYYSKYFESLQEKIVNTEKYNFNLDL